MILAQKLLMAGGLEPLSVTYVGSTSQATNNSSYTFTGVSFGVAVKSQLVICVMAEEDSNITIGSLTAAGISAVREVHAGSFLAPSAIFTVNVGAATSGDVVVTLSGPTNACAIAIYSMHAKIGSLSPAATNTSEASSVTSRSANLNLQTGDVVIACSSIRDAANVTQAWVGVNEDFEISEQSAADGDFSGGNYKAVAAETPRTVSVTASATVNHMSICSAVWRN